MSHIPARDILSRKISIFSQMVDRRAGSPGEQALSDRVRLPGRPYAFKDTYYYDNKYIQRITARIDAQTQPWPTSQPRDEHRIRTEEEARTTRLRTISGPTRQINLRSPPDRLWAAAGAPQGGGDRRARPARSDSSSGSIVAATASQRQVGRPRHRKSSAIACAVARLAMAPMHAPTLLCTSLAGLFGWNGGEA